MTQNFYQWEASMSKTYAYASGYQDPPEPERFLTPAFLKMKINSWEVNRPNRQPGIQLDDYQGLQYPDFLFCGGGPPRYFITQKVVDSLHRAEIRGFEALPMPMAPPRPRRLKDVEPPEYFILIAQPGIEIELPSLNAILDTWNGKPLFATTRSPTSIYCTKEVIDLAKADRWTNFEYKIVPVV